MRAAAAAAATLASPAVAASLPPLLEAPPLVSAPCPSAVDGLIREWIAKAQRGDPHGGAQEKSLERVKHLFGVLELAPPGGGDLQQVEDLMIMEAMRLSMNNEGGEGAASARAPAARDGVPAGAPTNAGPTGARPSATRSAQSAVALAVAAAAEDAMRAHDSDDDGDGGTSPGHGGLRGPSPGASPAMSPALQGLSGLAESFSPEQIPVDEDEQVRNRPREAQRSEKEISQTSR